MNTEIKFLREKHKFTNYDVFACQIEMINELKEFFGNDFENQIYRIKQTSESKKEFYRRLNMILNEFCNYNIEIDQWKILN